MILMNMIGLIKFLGTRKRCGLIYRSGKIVWREEGESSNVQIRLGTRVGTM